MSERELTREKAFANLQRSLEQRRKRGYPAEVQELLQKVELQQQSAQCDPILFDCCTVTLSPQSIFRFPQGLVNIGADFFFLDCCVTPVTVDAATPCGTISNAATVNEVKAIGHINYVASFTIPTYYNNGEGNCNRLVNQTFSCTGTLNVNNVLCYSPLDEPNPCPDFCNGNAQAFAYIADIDTCNASKAIVTIGVIVILPDCAS
ncbi:hypothetical protein [Bacillus sp. FJAT-50079]|uniref:hypothetical protein n=1 Tax=Bacillus sp. FJAT-50079 TaxID=2833577 RepID=UPI001BC93C02|nr:hypothetical protein [Bacillus sp. FJAT-50079]MBS4210084.1 hypothetical protein [Bacillus sp. FJAT-50079]